MSEEKRVNCRKCRGVQMLKMTSEDRGAKKFETWWCPYCGAIFQGFVPTQRGDETTWMQPSASYE